MCAAACPYPRDLLLLEVGFLCVWLCPLLRPLSRDPPSPMVLWLLRWCTFKLMLMSGAVKMQGGGVTRNETRQSSVRLTSPACDVR